MRRLLLSLLLLPLLAQAELAETDWLDLMPPEDQRALETMPEISHDSPETADGFSSQGGLRQREQSLPPVMYSNKTVARLDGRRIRLGGYPVPLENDAQGRSTLFFPGALPGRLHPRAAATAEPDRAGALRQGHQPRRYLRTAVGRGTSEDRGGQQ